MSVRAGLPVTSAISVGDGPHSVAVTGDGSRLYVSNFLDGTVSVVDMSSHEVIDSISVGAGVYGVAVTRDGERLLVAHPRFHSITPIDLQTGGGAGGGTGFQQRPYGLALTFDGDRIYAACALTNEILVTDGLTKTQGSVTNVDFPVGVAVTTGGSRLYATNYFADTVSVLDPDRLHLASEPPLDALLLKIAVPRGPYGIAVSPDGKRLYVAHFPFDTVSVIDTEEARVVDSIAVPDGPRGVAVSPDGSELYVTSYFADRVSVIALR